MSFTSFNGANLRKNSTSKGLVPSFGFTMPAELKKKIRPKSSFGMVDNYEPKTTTKPYEKSPNTPMPDTIFSNNKLVKKLISPTTQIPLKIDTKRRSLPEFSIKETYNYNRNGSKIASINRTSGQLSRPEVNYYSSKSPYKNTNKQMNDNKQVDKSFLNRLRFEGNSHSKLFEEEYTVKKEPIRKHTEIFDGKDSVTSEYGYGEALAVEECTEIKDKLHVIDKAFDNIGMSASLRNVLINVDDSIFETLAAISTAVRIEDETFPTDELFNLTDSEPEPDETAVSKIKLPTNNPELILSSSPLLTDYFEDDYFDQPGLTFNMTHHQTHDREYDGSLGSSDSGDYIILHTGNHFNENISAENVIIDDDYNSDLFMNSVNYNSMYNIANQEVLSETSECADMHDDNI